MFRILFAVLYCRLVFSFEIRSFILVSELTSDFYLSELTALSNSSFVVPVLNYSNSILPTLRSLHPNVLFDFTNSLLYQKHLKDYATQNEVLYFTPENPSGLDQKWVFYLHGSYHIEAGAISAFTKFLNWSDCHIISSESQRSRAIFSAISPEQINVLSNDADQDVFDSYASKVIKSSGNWKTVLISEVPGASKMTMALERCRIYKERCAFIVSSNASWGEFNTGTIAIVEEDLEGSQSEAEYRSKAVLKVLRTLQNFLIYLKGPVFSNKFLLQKLEQNSPEHLISHTYSIVNYKDSLQVVGKVRNGQVELFEEIVFPGNVTVLDNSPPEILISANTGPVEWDGSFNYHVVAISSALQPMVQIVNEDPSLLTNFHLKLHETDCGSFLFEYDYTSQCMEKHFDKLGLAHLAGVDTNAVISYLKLFEDYNVRLPNIGFGFNDEDIFNKTKYPEIVVTSSKTLYFYTVLPYVLRLFGWDEIILVFNDHIDPFLVSAFVDNAQILEINILNTAENMYIPYYETDKYKDQVKGLIEEIQETKCRIIVLMVDAYSHLTFIEALYDAGFRRGDLVVIFQTSIGDIIDFPEEYDFDRGKVIELTDGSLSLFFAEYVGEYGEKLEKQIAEMIHPLSTTNTCYRTDCLMLAVRTIDLMIQNGSDFEDFDDFMRYMRGIRFTGCTGKVSIDSQGNGLSDVAYYIYNFYTTDDGWVEDVAGTYTFGVTVPLNLSQSIIWPSGNTEIPNDIRQDPECGFSDDLISFNKASWKISALLTVLPFCLIFIACFCVWRSFCRFKRNFLKKKREMFFEDGVFLYLPLLEAFQFLGIGPEFRKTNPNLGYLCDLAILELESIIEFEYDIFWYVMKLALALSGIWCLSLCLTLIDTNERCHYYFRRPVEIIGLKYSQVFSQVLFVPANMLIFRIYSCSNGIGDRATESFLENDCKTFCWESSHLYYAIVATVILLVFNTCGIFSRLFYDEAMEYVSVKIQPNYVFLKGLFQLILTILSFNFKAQYEVFFSVAYCLVFMMWTVLLFCTDLYNYERLNWWERIIFSGVCAHGVVMVVYTTLEVPDTVVFVGQIVILLGVIGTGFYIQVTRCPSMLYKRKGRNFDKLLKFNFTNRVKPDELTLHELDYVNREEEVKS